MKNDLINCKSDFPIFNNQDITYLDTASTSQKPQSVINSLVEFYEGYNANVHRGLYPWAEKATSKYESARNQIANHINAPSSSLIFTKGTTESINFVSYSWGESNITKENNIVITEMEHHSNIVPWQILTKKTGSELRYIPISDNGELLLDDISNIIDENTKIVSVTHQSNVFGTINPINQIIAEAHNKGALILIDAAQSIGHQEIDVKNINCDFLVFSGHKILGPTGIGCLYIKENLLGDLSPYQTGGQMIDRVEEKQSTWNDIPLRFEAGTPNIAGVIGLSAALDYLAELGMKRIQSHNQLITEYCLEGLKRINNLKVYGHEHKSGPVISFNIEGIHSYDLTQLLSQQNIYIRSGHHCAQPIMKKLNIESSNRASLYIYNNKKDIDNFIEGIKKSIQILTG